MTQKIFKYTLRFADRQMVDLPAGAQILSVGQQGREIQMWALVDDSEREVNSHAVSVIGTGNPIPEQPPIGKFIGTVLMHGEYGGLVFHVFATGPVRLSSAGVTTE